MIKSKKQMFLVICVFALVLMIGTISYAFFNYTRTGEINNIGTGRISFNSSQSNTLSLTNVFPISSTDVQTANLDAVSIRIQGDTTYSSGEEFKISIAEVNDTITSSNITKRIPINYIANYVPTPVEQGDNPNYIGTNSNSYFTSRGTSNTIYQLSSTGEVFNGEQVLVGYIPSGETGIDGTLTIKAYIDSNKVAISDTTPAEQLDTNNDGYLDGTTSAWVSGRTVLTTAEWNSLANSETPISFKIRAESNEGIWINIYEIYGSDTITMKSNSSTTSHYDLLQYVYDPTSPSRMSLGNDSATWQIVPQTNDITVNDGVVTINSTNTLENFTLQSTVNGTIVQKNINVNILDNIPVDILHTVTMHTDERVNHLNGTIESATASMRSDYIEIDNTKTLFFDYGNYSRYLYPYMAFYDENYEYISGIKVENLTNNLPVYKLYDVLIQGYAIEIPNNAKYMIINAVTTTYDVYANSYYYVDNDSIELISLTMNGYSSTSTLNGLNIVNFGDSIFGKYADGSDISSYMETFYGSTNYNIGFGSTTMGVRNHAESYNYFSLSSLAEAIYSNDYTNQDANNNLKAYFGAHLATLKGIDFSTIDYVTIGYGINDFWNWVPIENNDLLDINTYKGAARYSINRLKQINPNLKIVLITPIYYYDSDDVDASNNMRSVNFLSDYCAALKEIAIEYDNVYVYDAFNDLQINSLNKYLYFMNRDKIHPTDNGIKLYAYKLGKFIENLENE